MDLHFLTNASSRLVSSRKCKIACKFYWQKHPIMIEVMREGGGGTKTAYIISHRVICSWTRFELTETIFFFSIFTINFSFIYDNINHYRRRYIYDTAVRSMVRCTASRKVSFTCQLLSRTTRQSEREEQQLRPIRRYVPRSTTPRG